MDSLKHYGVLGMKWGHRKGSTPYVKTRTKTITTKLKNGMTLTMDGEPTPAFTRVLAKYLPKVRDNINRSSHFKLKDPNGKHVGEMQLYKESKSSLNIVWVGVKASEQGHGYGTAAMKGAINFAKKEGLKRVTLEVPGSSPDARHIYEKLGFKADKALGSEDDIWGGLTSMHLDL